MDVTREQILVVDDEEDLRKAIVEILTLDGFEVDQVGSAEAAAEKLSQTHYDVLITDHNLPGKTGVELLEETLVRYPEIIGVVITGYGTIETAVSAIKKGAYNYLTKPFKLVELPIMVRKGLRERQLRFENQYLKKQLNEKYGFNNIIGSGRAMNRIFELVDTIAGLNSTVLIQGENGTVKVDVRIIAATSSNLDQMVKDGTFREDLFYRLNVIPINLPPLRERREDVPLLVQRFIEHFCERHKLDLKTISPQVTKALMAYEWPGNVRQLENIVERMVALTGNRPAILPTDLPSEIQNRESLNFVPLIEIPEEGINFQNVVTDMERELIVQSLRKTNGNKKLAAKLLNLKRTTLIEKIKRIVLVEHIAASA